LNNQKKISASILDSQHPPTSGTIAGHLLDSIFADTMHSDLERMARINETLKLISLKKRNANEGLKHIDSFVINPSQDINDIAAKYYYDLPISIRLLFRATGIGSNSESSLISYLLFDKNFCSELIKLGFCDAMHQEQNIRAFLNLT
jgi:NTE family protein